MHALRAPMEARGLVPKPAQLQDAMRVLSDEGLPSAAAFIELLVSLETPHELICFIGFTYDRNGLLSVPAESCSEEERFRRSMAYLALPHTQFGSRSGEGTALLDLVRIAEQLAINKPNTWDACVPELERMFSSAVVFFSRDMGDSCS